MNFELEKEFIHRYVVKNKQGRLLEFAYNPEKRDKFLRELNSPAIFDQRYLEVIEGIERTEELLPDLYKNKGMGGRVYIMSENSEWDTKKFQMSYIVGECLGMGIDTVGYCWKSKMALYEWHHSGASYLLKR